MYNPIVSIVIPVFNVGNYIRECLESILGQTYGRLQVICVDNGSSDDTLEIVKTYADKDSRLEYLTIPPSNAGCARNAGMAIATGKYLMFLDGDDFFDRFMVEHLIRIAERDDAQVVFFNFNKYFESENRFEFFTTSCDHRFVPMYMPFSSRSIEAHIFQTTIACPWNKLFQRKFVEDKNLRFQEITNSNDLAFSYTALALADRISYCNNAFVNYRIRSAKSSLQGEKQKNPMCFYHALQELRNRLVTHGVFERFCGSWLNTYRVHMSYNFRTLPAEALSEEQKKEVLEVYADEEKRQKESIKVTVMVAAYNAGKFIGRCLESLIEQSLRELEILVVNNNSTDDTVDVVRKYAVRDRRIRLVDCTTQGLGACRNMAIQAAEGQYIGWVDSDDFVDASFFGELYSAAQRQVADVAMTRSVDICDASGVTMRAKKMGVSGNGTIELMTTRAEMLMCSAVTCNKIYRTSLLRARGIKFGEFPVLGEDKPFNVGVLLSANRIAVIDNVHYHYTQGDSSMSNKKYGSEILHVNDFYQQGLLYAKQMARNPDECVLWSEVLQKLFKNEISGLANRIDEDVRARLEELADALLGKPARETKDQLVVSLTSFPARIGTVDQVVASILRQRIKPDKVVLWLAEEQFPRREEDLPEKLLRMKCEGLEIRWCKDIGSYKKLVPSIRKWPRATIVTADDDVIYKSDWLEKLWLSHLSYPKAIIAHRVRKIAFDNHKLLPYSHWKTQWHYDFTGCPNIIPIGCSGVLYPRNSINDGFLKEEQFMKLAPQADDLWFWGAAVLSGAQHMVAVDNDPETELVEGSQAVSLMAMNLDANQNDQKVGKILRENPMLSILLEDASFQRQVDSLEEPARKVGKTDAVRDCACRMLDFAGAWRVDVVYKKNDLVKVTCLESSKGMDINTPSWMVSQERDGLVLCGFGSGGRFVLQCQGHGSMLVKLLGPDVHMKESVARAPFAVDYASVVVNGVEQLCDRVSVCHDRPLSLTIVANANEKIEIQFKVVPHIYPRSVLRKLLLNGKLPFRVKPENVESILCDRVLFSIMHENGAGCLVHAERKARVQAEKLRAEVESLKSSEAYRVGMFVTAVPRYIKRKITRKD